MDDACLQHRLTEDERRQFETQGFLIVPGVLSANKAAGLADAADRIDAEWRARRELKAHQPLNLLDAIGKDDRFLELLDLPATFMKVVDILGWHIQLYHSHLIVTPPLPGGFEPKRPRLGWHQDSGRLNIELEGEPRPRVSLKVGFFFHQHPRAESRQLPRRAGQPPAESLGSARGRGCGSSQRDAGAGGRRRCRLLRPALVARGGLEPLRRDAQGALHGLQLPLGCDRATT